MRFNRRPFTVEKKEENNEYATSLFHGCVAAFTYQNDINGDC